LPQGPRLAVRRTSGERALAWGLVIPGGEDHGTAHVGVVQAAGRGHRVRDAILPLEVEVGDVILYSSRTDSFDVDGGTVDIVDENSVLGVL
jgi:co-chaperonin GroES (HSP10)